MSGAGSDSLVVTTSGGDYQIEFDGTAACSPYSDGSYPTVQVTDTGGVPAVFRPGTDTNITFEGPGAASTLDLAAAPAGMSVTLNGDSASSLGSVPWSGGTDEFSGISTFVGSSAGSTDFAAGPAAGYTFTGQGSGNTLDLSAATAGVDVSIPAGTVTGLAGGNDSFADVSTVIGSAAGGNTFVAGSAGATFRDTGTTGGDTVDFSQVTSSASAPLTVNVSGTQVQGTPNDTATAGPALYTLDLPLPLALVGSPGDTTFDAPATGGYTFTGKGTGTTLDLSAAPAGLHVSVPAGTVTGLSSGGNDTFSGISTFVGPSAGSTDFAAGPAAGYTFTGQGSGNTLDLSAATAGVDVSIPAGTVTGLAGGNDSFADVSTVIGSAAGGNTFVAGSAGATFRDTGTTGGDTVDFSQVTSSASAPLTVNVSGTQVQGTPNDTATAGPALYTLDLPLPLALVGSPGDTTFDAPATGGYTFTGKGTGTTLDLSAAPAGLHVSVPAGTVTGLSSGGNDTFSGISTFVGSSAGSTDFAAGQSGNYVFKGNGSGNTLDLSAAPAGGNVSMLTGIVTSGSSTGVFSDITTVVGSSAGSTDFVAGSAGGYTFMGQGAQNSLDLSSATVGVDVSTQAGSVSGLSSGGNDTFSGISVFVGSAVGGNTFAAGNTGGYTFTGEGPGNTLDLSAATSGVIVSMSGTPATVAVPAGTDSFADVSTVIGSAAGGNTFVAGSAGATFRDTGTTGGDTVDFSQVTSSASAPLTVNVSGTQVQGTPNDTATAGPALYTLDLPLPLALVGSPGDTTFDAPATGGYTFTGKGTGTTLDLSAAPAGLHVSVPAGTVTGLSSGGNDTFSGISTFVGPSAGSTDFAAGPAGGYDFQGYGSGNTLDLSAAPSGVTVTQNGNSLSSPGVVANLNSGLGGSKSDTFSGIQVVRLSSAMSLSSSADPSVFGQPVTFTATITPTDGGGTVAFYADGSATPISGCGIQSLTQVSGSTYSATCTTSSLPAGTHTISANYSGDSSSTSSTAGLGGGQTVNQAAAQSISFTAPSTGTVGTSATLTATGGASGNPVVFSVDSSSGSGVCNVSGTNGSTVNYTSAGSCVIDANQAGNADYTAAPQVTQTITVNQAPAFVIDSPPLTATAGHPYDYTFTASGTPAPTYALASGAPSWLSINATTGEVTGTPPSGTTSFSYSVTATNVVATATAGPFTVTVTKPSPNADLSATLICPASITISGTGTCTLTVANAGPATTTKVIAVVALPPALSETSCSSGCTRHANIYSWTLGSLASGASDKLAITVKASRTGTATVLAAVASQSPDPDPLNNISIQQISIKR